jgi:hypothetical protein
MLTWKAIEDTGFPDQEAEVPPFHVQTGPDSGASWSWTLLRDNKDGTEAEMTSGTAANEELAKLLGETAAMGALAQYETAEK